MTRPTLLTAAILALLAPTQGIAQSGPCHSHDASGNPTGWCSNTSNECPCGWLPASPKECTVTIHPLNQGGVDIKDCDFRNGDVHGTIRMGE